MSENILDKIPKGTPLYACPNCMANRFILIDHCNQSGLARIVCVSCGHDGFPEDYITVDKE